MPCRCGAQWRHAGRRMAVLGRLLIGVADLDQFGVAPRLADELQTGRQILAGKSHRHDKRRPVQPRCDPRRRAGRRGITVAVEFWRVARRRHDDGVEPRGVHGIQIGAAHLHFMRLEFAQHGIVGWVGRVHRRQQARLVQRMEFFRGDEFGDSLGIARAGRSQIALERRAHFAMRMRPRRKSFEILDHERIDDFGAETPQIRDGFFHERQHVRIGCFRTEGLAQHAKPFALCAIALQAVRVALRNMTGRAGGAGIGRIDAGNHVEGFGEIGHGARHRAGHVARGIKPDHAGARDQRPGRTQADDRVIGRRIADRAPSVGAEPDDAEIGRDAGARAARRTARRVGRVVRIAGKARQHGIDIVDAAACPFRHGDLGEHDGAGGAQLGDDGCIARRNPAEHGGRAAGRLHAGDVVIVLGQNRNAVQRGGQFAGGGKRLIQPVSLVERVRIERDHDAKRRPLLVVGGDAVEKALHDRADAGAPVEIGRVKIRNGGLFNGKWFLSGSRHDQKPPIGLPARQIAAAGEGRCSRLSRFASLCILRCPSSRRRTVLMRRSNMLSSRSVALRLVVGLMAAGFGAVCAVPHAGAQTRVNIAVTETSHTSNPYGDSNSLMYGVLCHVYGCLIEYDFDKADYTGLLAQSWEVADPRTWVFHLRRDIRWQNGEPLLAADVVHSFNRVMTDPQSKQKQNLSMVAGMEAVDDHTVKVTTKEPTAPLLSYLTQFIITNKAVFDRYGARVADEQHPVGAAQYKLERLVPGQMFALTKNMEFPGIQERRDAPDQVVYQIVREPEVRTVGLFNGEFHIIERLMPDAMPKVEHNPATKVVSVAAAEFMFLGMTPKHPPWNNKLVRQAVCYAIDRDAIVKGILRGQAIRLDGVVGSGQYGFDPHAGDRYPFDPEKAKALLKEAGFPNGVDVDFYTSTGRYLFDRTIAAAMVPMLRAVGIRATLHTPEVSTYWADIQRGRVS